MLLPKSGYKRHMVMFFYAVVLVLLVYLFSSFILGALFPVALAWLFAMAIRPLSRKAHKITGFSQKACSIVLCVCILLVIISVLLLGIVKLTSQIRELPKFLSDTYAIISEKLDLLCEKLSEYFPIRDGIAKGADTVRSYIATLTKNFVTALSESAAKIAKNVPAKLLALIIFVISCIYFCADLSLVNSYLYKILPRVVKERGTEIKRRFSDVMVKYVKAYAIMMLITFVMVYLGLLLLGYKYAAILAIIIAILDFLPAIGLGTVFIPWVIILFVVGSSGDAIKLLVLYVLCESISQVIRPKIIGSQLGIHPLATLVGLYVGFKLFGILGMFISPLAVILVKFLLEYFCCEISN